MNKTKLSDKFWVNPLLRHYQNVTGVIKSTKEMKSLSFRLSRRFLPAKTPA